MERTAICSYNSIICVIFLMKRSSDSISLLKNLLRTLFELWSFFILIISIVDSYEEIDLSATCSL